MKSVVKGFRIFGSLLVAVLFEWALNDSRRARNSTVPFSEQEHHNVTLPGGHSAPSTAAA